MPGTIEKPLTPEQIETLAAEAGENAQARVFCINGEIVEIPFKEALSRLPYDVMEMQKTMELIIRGQGSHAHFLSPMTSAMLLKDVGSGKVIENINKNSVNRVAELYGGPPVFGDDQDGILKGEDRPLSNDPNSYL